MSITDELRNYTEEQIKWLDMTKVHYRKLFSIADRIDAEHERQLANEWIHGVKYAQSDDAMSKYGYVKLPIDADGVPIHIGDVMEWVRYKDGDPTIVRTVSGIGNGVFFAWSDEQGRYAQYKAHAYRHHHAPTVEDVLREFAEKVIDSQIPNVHPTYEEAIAEYAAKLRLAGDGDE